MTDLTHKGSRSREQGGTELTGVRTKVVTRAKGPAVCSARPIEWKSAGLGQTRVEILRIEVSAVNFAASQVRRVFSQPSPANLRFLGWAR